MTLSHVEYGSGPPLMILHGLFGSSRNWATIAKHLAKHRHVYAIDMRNHGKSFWNDAMDYRDMAEDMRQFITRRNLTGTEVIGHSMGGKAAMAMALTDPHLVEKLVVVDIAPVEYEAHFTGYIKIMRGIPLNEMTRRSDADGHLAAAIPDPMVRAFLLQNLEITAGVASWRVNLEAIDRAMDDIRGFPDFPGSRHFGEPTLFVVGSASDYVQPGHHTVIDGLFPKATFKIISGAGHWIHADQPGAFLNVIDNFLAIKS